MQTVTSAENGGTEKKDFQVSIVTLARNCLKRKLLLKKIKEDPNYFFRYAKKFSICKTDIGPLLNCSTNSLINDKYEMCCLLTSVFTTPDPKQIVTDPVSFFAHEHITDINQKNVFNIY